MREVADQFAAYVGFAAGECGCESRPRAEIFCGSHRPGARIMIQHDAPRASSGDASLSACVHRAPEYPAPIPHVDGTPFTGVRAAGDRCRARNRSAGCATKVSVRELHRMADRRQEVRLVARHDAERHGRVSRSAFRRVRVASLPDGTRASKECGWVEKRRLDHSLSAGVWRSGPTAADSAEGRS